MSKSHKFYVYAHIDPNTNKPFYIGKGSGKRLNAKRLDNPEWMEKIKKLGGNYKIEILKSDLSEEEAYHFEMKYISNFGKEKEGGILINISPGGPSGSGVSVTIGDDLVLRVLQDPQIKQKLSRFSEAVASGEVVLSHIIVEELAPENKKLMGEKLLSSFKGLLDDFEDYDTRENEQYEKEDDMTKAVDVLDTVINGSTISTKLAQLAR